MSTEKGSECVESDSDDSPKQAVAPENAGDDSIRDDAQIRSASSDLLKSLYYWVLSRT